MQNTDKTNLTIYEPNYLMKAGIRIWKDMVKELIASRGLIWRLVLRDISARYKQSLLGVFWAFITPLALMFVFVWIKGKNILPIKNTNMPYASFVFLGQMFWLIFSQGVMTSAQSLVQAGSLVTKINFPREVLIFSKLGNIIFEFLVRVPLLLIVFFWTGFTPKLTIFLVPFALIPLLIMVLGIGFFVSLLNAVLRDIASFLMIVMTLGMFATPVVYPPPVLWPMSFLINYVNPVSGLITGARDLVSFGYFTDPVAYISSTILSVLIFLIGWRAFHLVEPKFAEGV